MQGGEVQSFSILDWVWSNKEWLFSGIGVALTAFFAELFRRRRGTKSVSISADRGGSVLASPVAHGSNISQTVNLAINTPTISSDPTAAYSEKPTPDEIVGHISSLAPYLRASARTSYSGLKVCWPVVFDSLDEIHEAERRIAGTQNTHDVSFRYSAKDHRGTVGVSCGLNIEDFPRLKISHSGARMRLSGAISRVSDLGIINLTNVQIAFD